MEEQKRTIASREEKKKTKHNPFVPLSSKKITKVIQISHPVIVSTRENTPICIILGYFGSERGTESIKDDPRKYSQ